MDDQGQLLFSDVRFHIAQCHDSETIKNILIDRGAKYSNYMLESLTHVIADMRCPDADAAIEVFEIPVVTSMWVHLSIKANTILPHEAFSPFRNVFSDVLASISTDLSANDIQSLAATLTYYGARLTKDVGSSTHFIVASAQPSDLPSNNTTTTEFPFKIVAPDWISDSIRQNSRCDESYYEPSLLLNPPPPTPTPPPPDPPAPTVTQRSETVTEARTSEQAQPNQSTTKTTSATTSERRLDFQHQQQLRLPQPQSRLPSPHQVQQHQQQLHQQQQQQQQRPQSQHQIQPQHIQHNQLGPQQSQIPRVRMVSNFVRGSQPKFRPILPPNNTTASPQRGIMQQQQQPGPRMMLQNTEPKKVTLTYNQYRKMNPYQNNVDMQQQHPQQQPHQQQQPPQQQFAQVQHQVPIQQNQNMGVVPNRLAQPNMYPQVRPPYQNNHMQIRPMTHTPSQQQPMMNHQHQPQPPQNINRFQDPNASMNQRPYQVCLQPQQNAQYQQNSMNRQPMYYSQGPQQMQMRAPQQVSMSPVQNEPVICNNEILNSHPQVQQPGDQEIPVVQQQTVNHQAYPHQTSPFISNNQQTINPHGQQQQLTQNPSGLQQQPNYQATHNMQTASQQVRPTRINFVQQKELRPTNPRIPNPGAQISASHSAPKISSNNQPHPSIFDHKHETNLAVMKAKVPKVTEGFQYFDYSLKGNIPRDKPLTGCRFMIADDSINAQLMEKLHRSIGIAGGSISSDLEGCTHLVTKNRLSSAYSQALKLGVRCVTLYWVNDVLLHGRMLYPWKAIHIPVPFSDKDKPLAGLSISVTKLSGRDRRDMVQMLRILGANFTDYFNSSNKLLVCGEAGSEKFEHAVEWKTSISNCQLISDILLSGNRNLKSLLTQSKYQIFPRGNPLRLKSYALIQDIMQPWTKPIVVEGSKPPENSPQLNGVTKPESLLGNPGGDDSGIATGGSNSSEQEVAGNSEKMEMSTKLTTESKGEESKQNASVASDVSIETVSVKSAQGNDSKLENDSIQMDVDSEFKPALGSLSQPTSMVSAAETYDKSEVKKDDKTNGLVDSALDIDSSKENKPKLKQEPIEKTARTARKSDEPIRLMFTHLESSLANKLQTYAMGLKMSFANGPTNCTHLITDCISTTSKFLCALSYAKYVLSYKWIIESHESNMLLDENEFILEDQDGEEKYSVNLIHSLINQRKRKKPLFNNFIFFVTPSVRWSVTYVKEMIESAGGSIATRKSPSKTQVNQLKHEGKRLIVITCDEDLHLCSALSQLGVEIVTVEFIISGILRQDIDFEAHRIQQKQAISLTAQQHDLVPRQTTLPVPSSQPNCVKKIRFDETAG